jgi:hypothetical protein
VILECDPVITEMSMKNLRRCRSLWHCFIFNISISMTFSCMKFTYMSFIWIISELRWNIQLDIIVIHLKLILSRYWWENSLLIIHEQNQNIESDYRIRL